MSFTLPHAYGGVTLLVGLITGNGLVLGEYERQQRMIAFNQDFLEYEVNEQHQREVGDDCAQLGHPDDGNGRYMMRRPYAEWYHVNIAKRIQRNDMEHLVTLIPLSLANGLLMPVPTIGLLMTYFLGRHMYSSGYQEMEGALNKYRMAGSLLCNLAHVGTLTLTVVLGLRLRRGLL